jgi:methionyl-tRNA synthetase
MGDALEALRIVAILSSPAIPGTAQTIWERIGMSGRADEARLPDSASWGGYPAGAPVVKGAPLFPRISA